MEVNHSLLFPPQTLIGEILVNPDPAAHQSDRERDGGYRVINVVLDETNHLIRFQQERRKDIL